MENIFRDFERNGRSCDLDEMDILMLNVRNSAGTVTINLVEEQDLARRNEEVRQVLERQKTQDSKTKSVSCVFCKRNGEDRRVYSTHSVKDEFDRVTCPILQNYKCPACGATGKKAHTIKYCPQKDLNQHTPLVLMRPHMPRGQPQLVGSYKCPVFSATGKKTQTINYCPPKDLNQHTPVGMRPHMQRSRAQLVGRF